MGSVKQLVENNADIYPITLESAVFDSNGVNISSKLENFATKEDLENVSGGTTATGGSKGAYYCTSTTEAGTSAKELVTDEDFKLEVGTLIIYLAPVNNTASNVTLNVNNTGAYPIWYAGSEYTSSSTTYCGYKNRIITYVFNGTHWTWISSGTYTSYSNQSLGNGYGTCTTAEATVAKVATLSSYSLVSGGKPSIKFTYAVPANATLNINNRGAKPIFYKGAKITAGIIKAGDICEFLYDGTNYNVLAVDGLLNSVENGNEVMY